MSKLIAMRRCAIPLGRGRRGVEEPKDRLRKARLAAGYSTVAEAARVTKLHYQNWSDHEAGRRKIKEHNAKTYAKKLKISWVWLLTGHDAASGRTVPLKGYVGAGAQVHALGAQDIDFVQAPPGAGDDDIAFEIRGASMPPFREGGLILATPVLNVTDVLYRLAVVDLDDGTRWFKQVMPSATAGRFTLVSLASGFDPMPDVVIASAARFHVYVEPS